jgi:hydrogenase small subunit
MLAFDRLPPLDRQGRPAMFYGQRLHDKCYRRPHFDAGQFVEKFDDEGARKGYCLYKVGCKGPTTYNACSTVEWNGGLSWPVKSGHGCLGCAEDNFWDKGSFRRRSSHWCCGTRGHFGYREGKRQEGKGGRGGEQWLA